MQLLFLMTFEKKGLDGTAYPAQLSVSEEKGKLTVTWTEQEHQKRALQEQWYEGSDMEEMEYSMKCGTAAKLLAGYQAWVSSFMPKELLSTTPSDPSMDLIDYYCENEHDSSYYSKLVEWRRAKAKEKGMSPFFIASNRLLKRLCTFFPRTQEQFLLIPGFGLGKWNQYGQELAEILAESDTEETRFPLDWIVGSIDLDAYRSWQLNQRIQQWQQERERLTGHKKLLLGIQQLLPLEQIASLLSCTESEAVKQVEKLSKEGYDITPWAEKQLEQLDNKEKEKIVKAFKRHGTRFLKPVLTQVYTEEEQSSRGLDALYTIIRLLRMVYLSEGEEAAV
ncbi:HRDC domain-containing protein [Marinicrinis lubricantis]|uniref:HRDC domain-containing protein n=1 Tax=Marinicrinis lubricantis TaxID=2086470 RepID=A0ABW1ILL7_9BACL